MENPSERRGLTGSIVTVGTPSSQSRSENLDFPRTQIQHFLELPRSYGQELRVVSSSGQSYTEAELCMCTDFSRPLENQLELDFGSLQDSYGLSSLDDMGDLRCTECGQIRPYHITSLST